MKTLLTYPIFHAVALVTVLSLVMSIMENI